MRYAVLEHRLNNDVHWDLLLQQADGMLRTWALESAPVGRGEINATALPLHRAVYLNYAGPVSRSRGWVRPWDNGVFQLLRDEPAEVIASVRGRRLGGLLRLRQTGDAVWKFAFDQLALGAKSAAG